MTRQEVYERWWRLQSMRSYLSVREKVLRQLQEERYEHDRMTDDGCPNEVS